ncbi:amino acid ABC transporter ATP-binding protein [Pseudorhodoferax soli]|nr:amino acid ABC transporter ATP-binding protein [Pseudorhodoferax soli]
MIQVKGVSKSFGANQVLRDISFDVKEGEVVVLVGPSGSGKSTLLRCINFLEEFQAGQILVDGSAVGYDGGPSGPGRRRQSEGSIAQLRTKAGMVFQNYNLFPHKTALENVMMGPVQVNGESKAEARAHALTLLEKVGLQERAHHFPLQLSGGQQQRVAIARALAMRPKVMLFDEVTSALDPELVEEVLKTLRDLSTEGMTMIIVTHEMQFARDVADRLLFFYQGAIIEDGPPAEFFANPKTERFQAFVRRFQSNSLQA